MSGDDVLSGSGGGRSLGAAGAAVVIPTRGPYVEAEHLQLQGWEDWERWSSRSCQLLSRPQILPGNPADRHLSQPGAQRRAWSQDLNLRLGTYVGFN